ncbi:ABC transporter ATP-binding protein [Virgibacillus sp. W0430]|uniref:ABC transporter ATP-binding protein n=1 Tax=Virgibacillus sp. W0430 TaxID=3391580 RepID=UPI003F454317
MVINMTKVSWKRSGKTILTDINWQVNKGEHWAVLGLNGSGKTTLLNMVNGYIWPTTGEVTVLGKKFGKTDLRELRQSIGWVSSSLQERMNGRHLVEDIIVSGKFASIGLYHVETTEADFERAHALMEQLGCAYLYNRTYDTCSNGEKQKILIARGLMSSPKLLILDEPTSGLDCIARDELLHALQNLLQSKTAPTLIYVTHHIEEVLPIFSHTLLMKQETIYDQGKRKDVLTEKNLSAFFEKPVLVEWHSDRPWMTLA